jgi:hypothetical protein
MSGAQLVPENPALPVLALDEGGTVVVGRDPGHAGVVVTDEGISRAHVSLQCNGGRVFVTDLRSMNGTYVEGSKLQPDAAIELRRGNRLIIGSERVVYRLASSGDARPAAPRPVVHGGAHEMMSSTPVFVVLYLLFMLPTYILPWVGSNATLLPSLLGETAAGKPYFWLHLLALAALIAIAWFRGQTKGKPWLILFPVAAAVFDLTPGLTWILFVPTIMHVMTLVFGIMDISIQSGSRK